MANIELGIVELIIILSGLLAIWLVAKALRQETKTLSRLILIVVAVGFFGSCLAFFTLIE